MSSTKPEKNCNKYTYYTYICVVNFTIPPITDQNKRCIYKFSFNDGSFYIGKSIDLTRRISQYKASFCTNQYKLSKRLLAAVNSCTDVVFEIVEPVPEDIDLRERETFYIRKHTFDNKCLNSRKYFV